MALTSLALGACAAPTSYVGISFAPGAAAGDLQELARQALAGDKQAQLDLGIAYEEGRGIAVDLKRAEELYRLAAVDGGGVIWIYSPPVGNGTSGRVVPIDRGKVRGGLMAARSRLDRLLQLP
jgi:hypothetical protein